MGWYALGTNILFISKHKNILVFEPLYTLIYLSKFLKNLKIEATQIAVFPVKGLVAFKTNSPIETHLWTHLKMPPRRILKKNLRFIFPECVNYYQFDLRWGVDDYPYRGENNCLQRYSILSTEIIHLTDRVVVSFPITDLIIGVEIAEGKYEELDDALHSSPKIFFKNRDITHLNTWEKLRTVYTLGRKNSQYILVIRGSTVESVHAKWRRGENVEAIASYNNQLKMRRGVWED